MSLIWSKASPNSALDIVRKIRTEIGRIYCLIDDRK